MSEPEQEHPTAQAEQEGEDVADSNRASGRRRMELMVQIVTALAVFGGIAITLATYYHKHSLIVWSVYFTVIMVLLVPFLFWQKRVWEQAEGAASTQPSVERPTPAVTPSPATTPQELHGLLIPANEPTPKHECDDVPLDALLLFVGGTLYWTKNQMEAINMYGYELLSIARAEGGLNVSARVLSEDNKVVAQITNNEFYVNPPQFSFQLTRPDWHTLIVSDNRGREALYVHYANPKAIIVRGRFYAPGAEPIVATENRLRLPGGNVFVGGCFGGMPTGMMVK